MVTRQEEAELLTAELDEVTAGIARVGRALREQRRVSQSLLTEVRRLRKVNAQLIARPIRKAAASSPLAG
ncbi:MAG TPA: hypothetical protein VIT43_01085 [Candidatus Dormibacteraeota bacterium]